MCNNKVNNLFRRIRLQRCTNFWVVATITSIFSLLHFSVGVAIGRYIYTCTDTLILECIICTWARVYVDKQYVCGKKIPKVKQGGGTTATPCGNIYRKPKKKTYSEFPRDAH